MRIRWSAILPIAGLLLFAGVSYKSALVNHRVQNTPSKYYWWSSLRLDSDPLNRNPGARHPCSNKTEGCGGSDPVNIWVQPGWSDKILIFTAFPAFLAGTFIVIGLSRVGVDEVLTFMVAMPILLFVWYYFLGRLIDRWMFKPRKKSIPDDPKLRLNRSDS